MRLHCVLKSLHVYSSFSSFILHSLLLFLLLLTLHLAYPIPNVNRLAQLPESWPSDAVY